MIHVRPDVAARLDTGGEEGVRAALQTAIELEHSTIPPYLYALYSLVAGTNEAVAAIIKSVVIEEMLHLALAANVLNALGGAPELDRPDLIPRYPGALPGSVESDLVVGLAPCSLAVVHDVFMAIEYPEDAKDFPTQLVEAPGPLTIGQYYRRIKEAIVVLGNGAFNGDRRRQLGPKQLDLPCDDRADWTAGKVNLHGFRPCSTAFGEVSCCCRSARTPRPLSYHGRMEGSMPSDQQLSDVLSEFARTMVTDFPIQGILDHLVQRIVNVLPITAAGVTLISPGIDPRYVAASNGSALQFEQLQTELGEGPCLAARASTSHHPCPRPPLTP